MTGVSRNVHCKKICKVYNNQVGYWNVTQKILIHITEMLFTTFIKIHKREINEAYYSIGI